MSKLKGLASAASALAIEAGHPFDVSALRRLPPMMHPTAAEIDRLMLAWLSSPPPTATEVLDRARSLTLR